MKSISDLAAKCIRCGFCLESCPTFQLTGAETESPRGRIYLARSADDGVISWEQARPHLERCLGCRACETACPSGVEYGELLEAARARLGPPLKARMILGTVTRPGLLGAVLKLAPASLGLPHVGDAPEWPPLEADAPIQGKVAFLDGCAMRVTHPRAHEASRRLLRRIGYEIETIDLGCCGALHGHQGDHGAAERLKNQALTRAGGLPIITDSAGCGSWLPGSIDIVKFLHGNGLLDLLPKTRGLNGLTAAYHDACHLSHGQGIRREPRELLAAVPGLTLVPLANSERCCGSAGIYSALQPELARQLQAQKVSEIRESGAQVLAAGNPGCLAWIETGSSGDFRVRHTVEVLEEAFCS